jgi:hypothetical protein
LTILDSSTKYLARFIPLVCDQILPAIATWLLANQKSKIKNQKSKNQKTF